VITGLPPLTRAQRAALTSVVAAGHGGALISNRNAGGLLVGPSGGLVAAKGPGFRTRVHWRTAEHLAALGYVVPTGRPGEIFATPLGRQRERIEQRRYREARAVDLRIGRPQRRHPSNLTRT
jgi:hypothetical protein